MLDETRDALPGETGTLSRRQALITLAALPTMLTFLPQGQAFSSLPEAFLPQCATSITACWHLMRGRDFLLVEKLLTRYLPTLADLSHQAGAHQTAAASLASQGYQLLGLLAYHRNAPHARDAYWQQALHYAEIANAPNLLATALIALAYNNDDLEKASTLYHRGLHSKTALSPLLRAYLYARLAVVAAQQGQEQEAYASLALAKETYPDHPENDPGFLYADFDPASLAREEGLTYLALAQQGVARPSAQRAWEMFADAERVQKSIASPARLYYEIINHQARTALTLNDQEAFCALLEEGINGARLLQSQQRMQEALGNYQNARLLWPTKKRIQAFADLFLEQWKRT